MRTARPGAPCQVSALDWIMQPLKIRVRPGPRDVTSCGDGVFVDVIQMRSKARLGEARGKMGAETER